jgi:hypothetical protein
MPLAQHFLRCQSAIEDRQSGVQLLARIGQGIARQNHGRAQRQAVIHLAMRGQMDVTIAAQLALAGQLLPDED